MTNDEEKDKEVLPVEEIFFLRAKNYFYANREEVQISRRGQNPFCGSLRGRSVASAWRIFAFFSCFSFRFNSSDRYISVSRHIDWLFDLGGKEMLRVELHLPA